MYLATDRAIQDISDPGTNSYLLPGFFLFQNFVRDMNQNCNVLVTLVDVKHLFFNSLYSPFIHWQEILYPKTKIIRPSTFC